MELQRGQPLPPINNNFNTTTLSQYNYTVYSNGTVSNGTNCYLTFGVFNPILFDNGTFFNTTSCDYPIYPIATRGGLGMAWAILLILLLPFTMFCLQKHGKKFVEEKKHFRTFARKWPWYWCLILQALGAIAGFFSVDLDRDYIQGSSLTSYAAIYSATLPVSLATCWETTRHWGSFEERKLHDEEPFRFHFNDVRSKVHLIMPVIFYGFGFLNFLLTVLRNWNSLIGVDASSAIDTRWKVGIFFAVLAWLQILAQIAVTRYYYKVPRVPWLIPSMLFLLAVLIAFHFTFIFNFNLSPFNVNSNVLFIVLMGYLPILLIVILLDLSGLARENEDRVLIELREKRDKIHTAKILQLQREVRENKNNTNKDDSSRIDDGAKAELSIEATNASSVSSQDSEEAYSSKFSRFFGVKKIKGQSWFSHNKYYFCNSRRRKQQLNNTIYADIGMDVRRPRS